jgi:hypothetical protein
MKKRVEIPEDIAADILVASNRTCCVCTEAKKPVQIHDIDEDPSNNDPANLAVLCLECHNETQIKGGFGRKLEALQIRRFKADWERRIRERKALEDAAVVGRFATHSSSNTLLVESPRLDINAVWYEDQHARRLLYIAHIDVKVSPPDRSAFDCEIRLLRINSPFLGERKSRDPNALKVTGARIRYRQSIPSDSTGTFDLFGMDARTYPVTYLLSESDFASSPIISTPEQHILTYQVFARDFRPTTFQIRVSFDGIRPSSEPTPGPYSSSGYPQIVTVIAPGQDNSDVTPMIWKPLPSIDLVEQSSP